MNVICTPILPKAADRKAPRILLLPLALLAWVPIVAAIVFAVRASGT